MVASCEECGGRAVALFVPSARPSRLLTVLPDRRDPLATGNAQAGKQSPGTITDCSVSTCPVLGGFRTRSYNHEQVLPGRLLPHCAPGLPRPGSRGRGPP